VGGCEAEYDGEVRAVTLKVLRVTIREGGQVFPVPLFCSA